MTTHRSIFPKKTSPPLQSAGCLAALTAVLWTSHAHAQQRLNVDFFQGPVVNSSRVIGMGGAFVGVAEGADGHLINPSSFAVRYNYTLDDWYDWDFALSWLNDAGRDTNEIDRSGRTGAYDEADFLEFGLAFRLGRFGFGLQAQDQSYTLRVQSQGKDLNYTYSQTYGGLGMAYAFLDGALIFGTLLASGISELSEPSSGTIIHTGGGLTTSVLWKPHYAPFRVGLVYRPEILGKLESQDRLGDGFVDGQETFGDLRVPDKLVLPWQVSLGASFMTGPRHYNPRPSYGEATPAGQKDPYRSEERRYLLLAADLQLTGPAENAIGTQSFLAGEAQQSGRTASLSLRLGAESEIIEDLVTVRAGTYYEPSRFEENLGRPHLTGGADYHLKLWLDWKISAVFDIASRYANFGVGVGFWH